MTQESRKKNLSKGVHNVGTTPGQLVIGFERTEIHKELKTIFINTSDSFAIPIAGECLTWVCINLCVTSKKC